MAFTACIACSIESGGKVTFLDDQHTCPRNTAIVYTSHIEGELSEPSFRKASAYTFDNYQDDAGTTAIYPNAGEGINSAISYTILGLIGEAGEIANKWKKLYRDYPALAENDDYPSDIRDAIEDELGDVLWYCARLATELETSLGEVAADNYRKLYDRKSRNVIHGSGDDR